MKTKPIKNETHRQKVISCQLSTNTRHFHRITWEFHTSATWAASSLNRPGVCVNRVDLRKKELDVTSRCHWNAPFTDPVDVSWLRCGAAASRGRCQDWRRSDKQKKFSRLRLDRILAASATSSWHLTARLLRTEPSLKCTNKLLIMGGKKVSRETIFNFFCFSCLIYALVQPQQSALGDMSHVWHGAVQPEVITAAIHHCLRHEI